MRRLLKMVLLPPNLLLSHAQGYVDLSAEVVSRYLCALKNRCLLWGLSVLALLLALVLGGLALMLWSAMPLHEAPHPWVLLALPGCCLILSAWCGWRAHRLPLPPFLQDLKAQMALDLSGSPTRTQSQGSDMTPAQRLAVSRARCEQALRDPVWLLLLQRWLEDKTPPSDTSTTAVSPRPPDEENPKKAR